MKDDLVKAIKRGDRISIATACFSIYAYQELKKQLESCEELRFIFTSPTFVAEKTPKSAESFISRVFSEKKVGYISKSAMTLRILQEILEGIYTG